LGKGVATSFVDLFLALFIWNVFTLRFQILWISTPFRLLAERSNRQRAKAAADTDAQMKLPAAPAERWLVDPSPSVSEHTTEIIKDYRQSVREESPR
jgi:hypothetical protein